MAFLEWDESFSVGVHCMDEQHTVLFDLINEFYDNVGKAEAGDNIGQLIVNLRAYTMMHFVEEEDYMAKFDYPDFESHCKEHEMFFAKVVELEDKQNSGQLILSFEITNFLKKWIVDHIKGSDKRYTELFNERGIR